MLIRSKIIFPLLFISACAPVTHGPVLPPVPPVPPVTAPLFEKTFGNATVGRQATMVLTWKSMVIAIDPDIDGKSLLLPQIDYILLTDGDLRHFGADIRASIRKKIKIIASPTEAERLKNEGFPEVKGLGPNQRTMLKKGDDFLFVSAAQNQNPLTKRQVSSYMLEFDNGRNLFVSGETTSADSLREFLYALRDDGKEIYEGFFYRQPGVNEATMAQMISLMQPHIALISQANFPGLTPVNEAALQDALKSELYDGPIVILKDGREIPF